MTKKKQIIQLLPKLAIILVWGIVCFWFFQTQFKYHFFYEEQNQLFLMDGEYVSQYFAKPAWFACLVGDFLTQFYYYLYVGPLFVTGVLLVMGDLLRRNVEAWMCKFNTLQKREKLIPWLALIIALLFITWQARLCLDETYRLSSLISLCGGATAWYLHNLLGEKMKKWWLRAILFFVVLIATYWLFGGLGTAIVVVFEVFSKLFIQSAIISAIVIAGIVYLVAPTCNIAKEVALKYPGTGKWVDFQTVKGYESLLQLDNEYYFGNYPKMVETYEAKKDNVTDEMTFYYSLALAQMGTLPEKMVEMKKPYLGTFVTIGEDTPMYTIKMINDLYWAIGDMTYTERAALLANTFSPNGRNVRMIKRLAEANLVSGDTIAANKYLRLLDKTLVYHQWAEDHTPGKFSAPVMMEINQKKKFINTTHSLRLGDSCYTILTQLLDSNSDNLVALDYLLCSDMLSKERDTFIYDYEKYNGGRRPFFQQIYESAKQSITPNQGE